jgi:hypothetical protein
MKQNLTSINYNDARHRDLLYSAAYAASTKNHRVEAARADYGLNNSIDEFAEEARLDRRNRARG